MEGGLYSPSPFWPNDDLRKERAGYEPALLHYQPGVMLKPKTQSCCGRWNGCA